jgi:hypothetical protein
MYYTVYFIDLMFMREIIGMEKNKFKAYILKTNNKLNAKAE